MAQKTRVIRGRRIAFCAVPRPIPDQKNEYIAEAIVCDQQTGDNVQPGVFAESFPRVALVLIIRTIPADPKLQVK